MGALHVGDESPKGDSRVCLIGGQEMTEQMEEPALLFPHLSEKEKLHTGAEVSFKGHNINISPNASKTLWRYQLKHISCNQLRQIS